jgi:endonuclease G
MKKLILLLIIPFLYITPSFADDIPYLYRAQLFTYGGLPVTQENGPQFKILINTGYAVGYSEELKNPVWAVYRLGNKSNDSVQEWERPWSFFVDTRTDSKVTHDDYTSSGYDRGHMIPNAAMLEQYGQMAQLETFLMSNICPQKPALNRGIWKNIEAKIGNEISQDDTTNKQVYGVYVITGPIFKKNPPDRLESGVAIPEEFYKIIAFQKGYFGTMKAVSFIFPQEPETNNFMDYVTTIDEIEKLTGLEFFPKLSVIKQRNLESKKRGFDLEEIVE